MTAAAFELQKAIYAALSGDAALKALIGDPARLYDAAPEAPFFPFVLFGDARESAVPGTDGLAEHDIRIAVHSRYEGRKEISDIAAAIAAALTAPLALSGFHLISLAPLSTEIFRREAANAHQGLSRFRAVTEAM